MIPSWPSVLPRPERRSYQVGRQDARLKRNPQAGPPAYRQRFSAVARLVSMSIVVTRARLAVFENFYTIDTAEGSLPFHMPDPLTDGWPLLTSDGQPLLMNGVPLLMSRRWLVLFGDQTPTVSPAGIESRISFSVAVMP